MHRWGWDLRYPPPHSTEYEYPIAAVPLDTPRYPLGPLVLPGKYSVRLTAGEHTETAEFTVKMDPRVKASPADLQKQFEVEMKVASGVSQSSEALTQARSIHEQITKLLNAATDQVTDSLNALDKKVSVLLEGDKDATTGGMKEPTLTDTTANLTALYKAIDQADAAPTAAQIEASTKNEAVLETILAKWNELKNRDIPALNQQLRTAGLPALKLDLPPQQQEGGEDEE
jgi:L-2-hydroxyglutarate oxidase LhgO